MMIRCMIICSCNIVLDYIGSSSKAIITHCLQNTSSFQMVILTIQMWMIFFYVSCYPPLTKCPKLPIAICMQWNYFGSGHGKGKWDGPKAHIKQALKVEYVKP